MRHKAQSLGVSGGSVRWTLPQRRAGVGGSAGCVSRSGLAGKRMEGEMVSSYTGWQLRRIILACLFLRLFTLRPRSAGQENYLIHCIFLNSFFSYFIKLPMSPPTPSLRLPPFCSSLLSAYGSPEPHILPLTDLLQRCSGSIRTHFTPGP